MSTAKETARQTLVEKIAGDHPSLSRAFKRVADILVDAPADFMAQSIHEISLAAGVSEPSVIRFCRHYGFDGMPEFRIALAMSLAADNAMAQRPFLEPSIADKAFVNRSMKLAVARAAAGLLETDRSLILNSGSTIQLFAARI